MTDWRIFKGDGSQHDNLDALLPDPPPWRSFSRTLRPAFVLTEDMRLAVNAALYLRRPLLLTGKPGTGKSSLIEMVAHELQLGHVLRWSVTSKTTLKSGMYEYDALGRLNERVPGNDEIDRFITLGPLGTALQASSRTRALLIDEIDKGDLDFPNDLLHVFERGEYTIPELERYEKPKATVRTAFARIEGTGMGVTESHEPTAVPVEKGTIRCEKFPFIVLTSNGEREFPAPFLRRCIQLEIKYPDKVDKLRDIVLSHLSHLSASHVSEIDEIAQTFLDRQSRGDLANDQLLNAVFLACDLKHKGKDIGADREWLIQTVMAHITTSGFTGGQ
jgi:MoxR-like ATPase